MGERFVRLISQDTEFHLMGAIEVSQHPGMGQDVGCYHGLPPIGISISETALSDLSSGVVLDFSLPGGPTRSGAWAMQNQWALIVGTTALNETDRETLFLAGQRVPVLHSPNFSIGIQIMMKLVNLAARQLPEFFDGAITETHHRTKLDRPSGTARSFQQTIIDASPMTRSIDMCSIRTSTVIGEHDIRFTSPFEEVRISHRALTRDVFVRGALDAAKWIVHRPPGYYSMDDVVGN